MHCMKTISEDRKISTHIPRDIHQTEKERFFSKPLDVWYASEKKAEKSSDGHEATYTRSVVVCTPSVRDALIEEFRKLDIPKTDLNIVVTENIKRLLGLEN